MTVSDLLSAERVSVRRDPGGSGAFDKPAALAVLAALLAGAAKLPPEIVEKVLAEREALQSTGVGDGVAIPHGALADLDRQYAALLIVPSGIDFDAIDGQKVNLLFAVITPKRATGEHLKTLARISRLLRSAAFRQQLLGAPDGKAAYDLIVAEEGAIR